MITLTPLRNNNYYNSINFELDETNLTFNISGVFNNNNINTSLNINPNSLITSITVINNSLTTLYTYLLVDLYSYTYASNSISFNSSASNQPEFLLYLDNNYTCINDYVNLAIANPNLPLNTKYSYTSGTARFSYTSLSALYSATALYSYTTIYAKNVLINSSTRKIDIFDIPYSRLFVSSTGFIASASQYDSVYDYIYKKLYVFIDDDWHEVNWRDYIKRDRLYRNGILRFNKSNSALEYNFRYSSYDWSEVIPTIGKIVKVTYGWFSSNTLYYIAPGQIAVTNWIMYGSSEALGVIFPNTTALDINFRIDKTVRFSSFEILFLYTRLNYNYFGVGYSTSVQIDEYVNATLFNFNNFVYGTIKTLESSSIKTSTQILSLTNLPYGNGSYKDFNNLCFKTINLIDTNYIPAEVFIKRLF
jgi:hypothetical protein